LYPHCILVELSISKDESPENWNFSRIDWIKIKMDIGLGVQTRMSDGDFTGNVWGGWGGGEINFFEKKRERQKDAMAVDRIA
jgi:hypothetical protein